MPAGRPTDYSLELGAEICAQLASGRSLSSICRDPGMPVLSTIYLWRVKHPEFSENYTRAREDQADTLADQILDIADDSTNDYMETEKGEVPDLEHINRSRLRVDSRKWIAAKLKPKNYGDHQQIDVRTPDGLQLQTLDVNKLLEQCAGKSDEQLAEEKAILERAIALVTPKQIEGGK